MINIIEATEENMPQILKIEQDAISPPWSHGALLSEVYRDDSYFAVAVDSASNNVLGFAILRRTGDDGELLQIAVDKPARCGGIGDLLTESVINHASKAELKSVFLEVRRGNTAAIHLYKKHGFKPIRVRRDYYLDPVEDAVVMGRHSTRR